MSNYSKFQIIKIIDEYSVVINGGVEEDLSVGEEVEIFVEGEEIKDPFNENRILGTLDYIKDYLEVTEVYRGFAVCVKYIEKEVYHPSPVERAMQPTLSKFNIFGGGARKEKVKEKAPLKVAKEEITGRVIDNTEIKIGDYVRVSIS